MTRIFVTGFPGFLAAHLVPELLLPGSDPADDRKARTAACLVESGMAKGARALRTELEARHPSLSGRIELVEGDLTTPEVLAPGVELGRVDRAYHLAAVYTLDVKRELAMAVNVQGTRNVLTLLRKAPELEALHHISTCYVSGRHPGIFREGDLDVGQRFNNHYEETKFLAEVEVRRAREEGTPVTVFRPAVVTGDSRTGAAEKLDGLFYLLQWIHAQGRVSVFPRVPGQGRAFFNVVPSDFVTRALAALSERPDVTGKTFHLADPDPLPITEIVRLAGQALGSRVIQLPTPTRLAAWITALAGRLPGFPKIPPQSMAYLSHPTRYDTAATAPLLEEEGIRVPPLREYLPRLAGFLKRGDGSGR
jgi:thioester reductase-like protein